MSPHRLMSFKPAFRSLMDRKNAWFQIKVSKSLKIKNGVYGHMKAGGAVKVKYITKFLEYIYDRTVSQDAEAREKQAVRDCIFIFLSDLKVPNPAELEPDQLVEHLCTQADSLALMATTRDFDWRDLGMDGFVKMFITRRKLYDHVQGCGDNEALIREAITWFFDDGGNLNAEPRLSTDQAIAAVEKRFHMSLDEYLSFVIKCHRRNPWTVVLARGEKDPIGISIILPLRESVYHEVRNGKIMSCSVNLDALTVPSRHLIIEAQTPRPAYLGGETIARATLAFRWCVTAQIAALSRFGWSTKGDPPLYLLGIDGTPEAGKQLLKHGFVPTGTRMHTSGENLYERTFLPEAKGMDALFAMLLRAMADDLGDSPPL